MLFDDNLGFIAYNLYPNMMSSNNTNTTNNNPNLINILTINNIDGNSFNFTNGQITFNSTSKLVCTEGAYSGSTFNITYANGVFNAPTYISGVLCQ